MNRDRPILEQKVYSASFCDDLGTKKCLFFLIVKDIYVVGQKGVVLNDRKDLNKDSVKNKRFLSTWDA